MEIFCFLNSTNSVKMATELEFYATLSFCWIYQYIMGWTCERFHFKFNPIYRIVFHLLITVSFAYVWLNSKIKKEISDIESDKYNRSQIHMTTSSYIILNVWWDIVSLCTVENQCLMEKTIFSLELSFPWQISSRFSVNRNLNLYQC